MRVHIEAESQEEFDSKRVDLIRALAGSQLEVIEKAAIPKAPTPSEIPAQNQMIEHWDARFRSMISKLKADIAEIIGET